MVVPATIRKNMETLGTTFTKNSPLLEGESFSSAGAITSPNNIPPPSVLDFRSGRHNTAVVMGAYLYFFGRLAYLPVYGLGVPRVRTLVWGVSIGGILLVFWGLFIKILPYGS